MTVETQNVAATIMYEKGRVHTKVHICPGLSQEEKRIVNQLYLWPRKIHDTTENGKTVSTMRALTLCEPSAAQITTDQIVRVLGMTRKGEILFPQNGKK